MDSKRSWMRWLWWRKLPLLFMLPLTTGVHALRVNDIPLYATLSKPAEGLRKARACAVPRGSHVELVGEVSGLGVAQGADRRWFVRVISGTCKDAELTLTESCLLDVRSQPEPSSLNDQPR